ncbi:hypothetical protein RirG_031570 [Rhizophagus irregularis DAOM 197198w]|uniref:Uncharacterized protein n=1 Tax=Rhizophagus irregularis (strain DAOM 197198w) TaxID=1432141 RepID=A0A015LVA4_RHIIW|nr:hypothetical protein RirG_031570 [Rhizophagus irregularis DAOM 197198w]
MAQSAEEERLSEAGALEAGRGCRRHAAPAGGQADQSRARARGRPIGEFRFLPCVCVRGCRAAVRFHVLTGDCPKRMLVMDGPATYELCVAGRVLVFW